MQDEFEKIVHESIGKENMEGLLKPEQIRWDVGENGKKLKTMHNLLNFFAINEHVKNLFRFNAFTQEVEYTRSPHWDRSTKEGECIKDDALIHIKAHLSTNCRFDIGVDKIHEAIIKVAQDNRYHPIKRYLEGLTWDGTPRIENWLMDFGGAPDNPYVKAVSSKILLAAIARIYNPGCKFDYMVILEGEQGIGKSTLVEILGGEWYGDINIFATRDKDTIDAMRGKWIVEVAELVCFKKAEIEAIKAFLSRKVDRTRLAYDRITKNFPRQCVFFGTVNPDDSGYLRDSTGNRRFWPLVLTKIDVEGLKNARDLLWAEALARFRSGKDLYYLQGEALDIANAAQKEREVSEPWTEVIGQWLKQYPLETSYTFMDIATGALKLEPGRVTGAERIRIGAAMKQLGWRIKLIRNDGKTERKYFLEPNDEEKQEPWDVTEVGGCNGGVTEGG